MDRVSSRRGGRKLPPKPLSFPPWKNVSPFFLLKQSEGNVTKRKNPNYNRFHVFDWVTIVVNSLSLSMLGTSMHTGKA